MHTPYVGFTGILLLSIRVEFATERVHVEYSRKTIAVYFAEYRRSTSLH